MCSSLSYMFIVLNIFRHRNTRLARDSLVFCMSFKMPARYLHLNRSDMDFL